MTSSSAFESDDVKQNHQKNARRNTRRVVVQKDRARGDTKKIEHVVIQEDRARGDTGRRCTLRDTRRQSTWKYRRRRSNMCWCSTWAVKNDSQNVGEFGHK